MMPLRVLVFDLIEGMRIILRRAAEITGTGIHRLLGAFLKVIDPHAEMHQAVIALVKAWNLVVVFQQRNIDGAVGDVAADTSLADPFMPKASSKNFAALSGSGTDSAM